MRFTNDSGTFGLVLTPGSPHYDACFFRFQLVMGGELVGDEEPSILGSAMPRLADVPRIEDDRLSLVAHDADAILDLVIHDESVELHDRAVFTHSESLDAWETIAFRHGNYVVWIVRRGSEPYEPAKVERVSESDYLEIVDAATSYWEARQAR